MVDWSWFGWTLAGSAFSGSSAMYLARTFLGVTDVQAVQVAGVVFSLVLGALVVSRIRFNAWKRDYLLSEDFSKDRR